MAQDDSTEIVLRFLAGLREIDTTEAVETSLVLGEGWIGTDFFSAVSCVAMIRVGMVSGREFVVVARTSSVSDPSLTDKEQMVLEEERISLPIDTGTWETRALVSSEDCCCFCC